MVEKDAEEIFKKHLYPERNIRWIRYYNNIEIERFITTEAMAIFMVMAKNMRQTSNLIQCSQNDLTKATGLNKRTVSSRLKELIEFGCIAIKIKGTRRRASVYMVNPLLATVGNSNQSRLSIEFWELTGSIYAYDDFSTLSEIHKSWLNTTTYSNYSLGYDKQITEKGTIYFNKINEPKIKKCTNTKVSKQDDDDLPI